VGALIVERVLKVEGGIYEDERNKDRDRQVRPAEAGAISIQEASPSRVALRKRSVMKY
jgi:hypothetical protein